MQHLVYELVEDFKEHDNPAQISLSSSQKINCGSRLYVERGGIATNLWEYVVTEVPLVVPPPTVIPFAMLPANPPMPKAFVTEPALTPIPDEDELVFVVAEGK